MAFPPRAVRLNLFFEKLLAHPPVADRKEALSLLVRIMAEVEDFYGLPKNDFPTRMGVFRPQENNPNDWKDLDSDPCYWDDSLTKTHRTIVYNNGRIIIKNIKSNPAVVVLDKSGA
ncbi:hypothetical protein AB7341_19845 [Providencia huaxiensis]|uniref:hypothetical protein n=1 Tax=Providencia huaxiensis TaxID=2027290 RepID=UPI0034E4FDE5